VEVQYKLKKYVKTNATKLDWKSFAVMDRLHSKCVRELEAMKHIITQTAKTESQNSQCFLCTFRLGFVGE